jgi:hypothetical protein
MKKIAVSGIRLKYLIRFVAMKAMEVYFWSWRGSINDAVKQAVA